MRLILALAVMACCSAFVADAAPVTAPSFGKTSLVIDAKFVCGDFGQGWTCKREPGFNQFGKGKTPGGRTSVGGSSDTAPTDPDALPPASSDTGYAAPPAGAAAAQTS